jgi:hypothetical protein
MTPTGFKKSGRYFFWGERRGEWEIGRAGVLSWFFLQIFAIWGYGK